jgi:hypothetical protein
MNKLDRAFQNAVREEDKKRSRKLAKEKICLDLSGPNKERNDLSKVLSQMIGSTIVDAGFVEVNEGGLTFDFVKKSDTGPGKKYRLVVGYNELGEWVHCFEQI